MHDATRAAAAATGATQHLAFTVAGTTFGVPVLRVKEILQHEGETKVPGSPASVRGVVNVRGEVVPLVDLGVKFGMAEVVPTPRTCVLVVEARLSREGLVFGLIVDRVEEVVELPESEITAPPDLGTGARVDYLRGMGKAEHGFLLLLDLDRTLSDLEKARVTELCPPSQPNRTSEGEPTR